MRQFDLLIDGQCQKGEDTEIRSPYDDSIVGKVSFADKAQVAETIAAARKGAKAMAKLPTYARVKILQKIAAALTQRSEEIAQVIRDEAGKPIQYAQAEASRAADTFIEAAEQCKRLSGELIKIDAVEPGDGRHGLVRWFPIGAVAGISPFNFPLNLAAHKIAPALAAGNAIVLKPASQTPMSALIIGQVAREAGLPEGGLSVVPTSRTAADQLIIDDRLELLTFTGSAEVGWSIKSRAGRKKVVLELGGNAAALVGTDVDLSTIVPRLVIGSFAYAGQVCISVQRIFVLEPVAKQFIELFVQITRELAKVGHPADSKVVVGPMIDPPNQRRVIEWIEEARSAGAKVLCGGSTQDTCITPTVITEADPNLKVCAEEVFGPVVVVEAVKDWDEAIQRTNDSRFGLQAGVFTNEIKALWQCFDGIQVGGVIHNDFPTFRVDHMPYGGVKESGFGREGPRYAIEEMSERRLLVLNP